MSHHRPVLAGLVLLVVGLAAAVASPSAAAPTGVPSAVDQPAGPMFTQQCGADSWWAGSTNLCDGALVYRDYVYDDAGADEGDTGYGRGTQNAYGTLAHPAGDVRYPADAISTADLVSLTLTRAGDRLEVVAQLNALYTPDSTVLAVAIDSDNDPLTGGGDWDGLGVHSGGWDALHVFKKGDPATNTIRGSLPLPSSPTFRVQAVTAQAADGSVMNIAFRGVDEDAAYKLDYTNASPHPPTGQGAWFEDNQAAALQGGDISAFGVQVTAADLRPGVTRLQELGPGLHERVYTSDFTIDDPAGHPGEGMSYAGVKGRGDGGSATAFAQVFNFLGKYQPYGVYVPDAPGPYGLQMEWHGSNQGIVAQINQPGMQADFGDELNRVLVTPLARGPNGYGSDVSERDLLDVLDDAEATFPVDRARVFSSGYSQGGYIAFRMAMLYPDRFAGFTSWVGFTGNDTNGTPARGSVDVNAGAVGNMIDYVGNQPRRHRCDARQVPPARRRLRPQPECGAAVARAWLEGRPALHDDRHERARPARDAETARGRATRQAVFLAPELRGPRQHPPCARRTIHFDARRARSAVRHGVARRAEQRADRVRDRQQRRGRRLPAAVGEAKTATLGRLGA